MGVGAVSVTESDAQAWLERQADHWLETGQYAADMFPGVIQLVCEVRLDPGEFSDVRLAKSLPPAPIVFWCLWYGVKLTAERTFGGRQRTTTEPAADLAALNAKFGADPEALAWARGHVQRRVDKYRNFSAQARDRGNEELAGQWRKFANLLQMEFDRRRGLHDHAVRRAAPEAGALTAEPIPVLEPSDGEIASKAFADYLQRSGMLEQIDEKQCAAIALVFLEGFTAGAGHMAGKMRAAEIGDAVNLLDPKGPSLLLPWCDDTGHSLSLWIQSSVSCAPEVSCSRFAASRRQGWHMPASDSSMSPSQVMHPRYQAPPLWTARPTNVSPSSGSSGASRMMRCPAVAVPACT